MAKASRMLKRQQRRKEMKAFKKAHSGQRFIDGKWVEVTKPFHKKEEN